MATPQSPLLAFVQQISKEKGLDPAVIKEAIEQAVVSTSKKSLSQFHEAKASLNLETGELQILVRKKVVEKARNWRKEISLKDAQAIDPEINLDDEVDAPIPASDFGRVAAQSARQIIMQRLRDAEREKIFEEYHDRAGQIVTGVIQRFERRDAIVNIGDTEGILPYDEQPMGVRYKFGDRIKCLIQRVEMTSRGPSIRLSRNSPDLIEKLFALEVPEIHDGIVQIVAIAREAGVRTKLAVTSRNPDVDPVGACVGMKGSRVQMIVREFENEKIDIVPYSANPVTFIVAALNPAQIMRVDLDEDNGLAQVVVPRDNLSLAIGKRGQNARLASKLTGWHLDIKCAEDLAEAEAREEARVHYLRDFLDQLEIGVETKEAIAESPYASVEQLAEADPATIQDSFSVTPEQAEQICEEAGGYMDALQEMQGAEGESTDESAEGEVTDESAEGEVTDESAEGESTDESAEEESGGESDTEPRMDGEESPDMAADMADDLEAEMTSQEVDTTSAATGPEPVGSPPDAEEEEEDVERRSDVAPAGEAGATGGDASEEASAESASLPREASDLEAGDSDNVDEPAR